LAGDLRAEDLFPPDIKRIKDRGALIVAQYGGERPGFFEFVRGDGQDGVFFQGRRLVGFDIDLARDIARELGVDLKLDRSAKTFDAVVHMVASGQADIGLHLGVTLERAQSVNFTRPFAEIRVAILVDRVFEVKAKSWKSVTDLCNRSDAKIGVWDQSGAVYDATRLFPKARIVKFPDLTEMRTALRSGAINALFATEYEVLRMLRSDPSISLTAGYHVVSDFTLEIAIAVRPDGPNLLNFLNLFLHKNKTRFDTQRQFQRLDGKR